MANICCCPTFDCCLFVFLIRGTDLMMHPDLQIDVGFLGALLTPKVEQELLDT